MAVLGTEAEMPVLLATAALALPAAAAGTETLTLAETDAAAETLALTAVGDAAGISIFTGEDEDTETWAEAEVGSDCRGGVPDTAADTGAGLTGEGGGSAVGEASGRLTDANGPD